MKIDTGHTLNTGIYLGMGMNLRLINAYNTTCPANLFNCSHGPCISTLSLCDGVKDCPMGEDEKDWLSFKYHTVTKLDINYFPGSLKLCVR